MQTNNSLKQGLIYFEHDLSWLAHTERERVENLKQIATNHKYKKLKNNSNMLIIWSYSKNPWEKKIIFDKLLRFGFEYL